MDIFGAAAVLQWNSWLLRVLGIWPLDLNNSKFIFYFIYVMVQCILQYADLIEHISDLKHVVKNLTETVVFSAIAIKIAIYRINTKELRELIRNIEKDFSKEVYNTANEVTIFLEYNSLSKTLVQWFSIMSFSAVTLFYVQPLISRLLEYSDPTGNSTSDFVFPFHIRLFFNLTEKRTYYIIYACDILVIPLNSCGYGGTYCLLLTLVLHGCGQISILACQVKNMMKDSATAHRQLKQIVIKHCSLISFIANVQSAYSTFLLQELFTVTLLTCLGCYNVIATSVFTNGTSFLMFSVYILSVICQLLGLCYIGECLMTESTNLYNAFCNYEWYNLPPDHLKLFIMCLLRSQKPLELTAGKFYTFSLESFTTIMKTSMAYLSVLRNFI